MQEIVKIVLDNEMDLILAHKRTMRISEMCGLPIASQTRISTAVSEIARCAIASGKHSKLTLGIENTTSFEKHIIAMVSDDVDLKACNPEAYRYAEKISGQIEHGPLGKKFATTLKYRVPTPGLISASRIAEFKEYFRLEPPLSPYDEIRKKNIELIALSEKLGESESKYRQLSNTIPILVFTLNSRGVVDLTNKSLKKYFNRKFEQLTPEELSGIMVEDDVKKVIDGWQKARKSESAFHSQVRLLHEGEQVWHILSIVPNKETDGNAVINWTGILVDIAAQKIVEETLKDNTELKRTQDMLKEINKELSMKNRELEQFAFVASHDLQEPLRKIMMMTSMAEAKMSKKEQRAIYFDKITSSAQRMSNLIEDVLNYSRNNQFTMVHSRVSLNQLVAEVCTDLDLMIDEKQAIVEVGDLPEVTGDYRQLRQVFFNLISNALKFNVNKPVVKISSEFQKDGKKFQGLVAPSKSGYQCISVSDNGIGIEEQYAAKIFTMFQRLHHRDVYQGNGIGLALCRRIVESHGGVISFVSENGKGTSFEVCLPAELVTEIPPTE